VIPALLALAERHPDSNLLVTTHGGVIRTLLNHTVPDLRHHRGVPITNGSVHSFRHVDDGLELVLFDDPIDLESVDDDSGDILDQNAVEQREAGS
jgi:broad specificity phosphatase PhoE